MNHHSRSFSEQPAQMTPAGQQPQSFIRIHSDSQQSLDQLFNPTSQPTVPLRNRNLPHSFFNPSVKPQDGQVTNGSATNGHSAVDAHGASLHQRSISFDQRQQVPTNQPIVNQRHLNLHTRTHSSIVPMPRLVSNHSSQEFLDESAPMQLDANNVQANNVSTLNSDSITLHQSYQQDELSQHHHSNNHTSNTNHNHQSTISNGWSSTGNSLEELSPNPQWIGDQHAMGPQQPNLRAQVLGAPVPAVPPEPAAMQQATHPQVFYSTLSVPAPADDPTQVHVVAPNNFHGRSISFHQRPPEPQPSHGFHMRTHSTIAPMSGPCNLHPAVASHQSSHQSSQDYLNHSAATDASGSTGWSSSGYSTDDMTANGQCWPVGGPMMSTHIAQAPVATASAAPLVGAPAGLGQHVQATVVTQAQDQASSQVFYQV